MVNEMLRSMERQEAPFVATQPDDELHQKESPRRVSTARVILQWFKNHLAVAFLPVPDTDARSLAGARQ